MNLLTFFEDDTIMAAMTLRDCTAPLCGNMALHTGEEAGAVMENRRRLSEETLPLSRWCCAMQTHSANAYAVTAEDAGRGALTIDDAIPACDALYTRERGVLIGVFTADCVPLLLHDPHSGIIAAIHAGWPGTVKQITHHTVSRLIEREGLDARTVQVWIGPCIHQPSFQIREDVIAQIRALPFDTSPYLQMQADGIALADNVGLNVHMLRASGIPAEHIFISEQDTCAGGEAFFSYRRDRCKGRHFSFLYKK